MGFRRLHLSFTEYRRRRLAKKVDRLDRLESRTTITEPLSFTGMAISALTGLVRAGFYYPDAGSDALRRLAYARDAANRAARLGTNPIVVHRELLRSIDAIALNHHTGGGSSASAPNAASSASAPPATRTIGSPSMRRRDRVPRMPTACPHPGIRPRDPAAVPPRHLAAAQARLEQSHPPPVGRSRPCDCRHPRLPQAPQAVPPPRCSRLSPG